jgi:hypothetical protein
MDISHLKTWVITEGMIGTENQCLGVCDALGINPKIKHISLNQPWKSLTPWLSFEQSWSFKDKLEKPWPDLVIASGRKAIAASRYIKKKSNNKTFTVHIQDPKCTPKDFDLVAVPHHDSLRGDNVIVTDGAPNRMTKEKLQKAKEDFADLFVSLTSPRVAVLIGGNSRTYQMTPEITKDLVTKLKSLDADLMITASRRTGDDNLKILQDGLKNTNAYIWDGVGVNPYHGMLAWADYILVTSDSVSMISDAATTGNPVHIIPLEGSSKRFDRFHKNMEDLGVSRPFLGNLDEWSYEPLNDAEKIAEAIKEAMQKRYG